MGAQQELSEEEVRQYLSEMRQAPAAEIIAQVITVLANGAQVKLGRNDARVLIDTIDAVKDRAGAVLPADFVQQVDELLGQLRMAQVEGEKEVARLKAEADHQEAGDVTTPTPGQDAPTAPGQATPPTPPPTPGQDQGGQQGSGGSRLWTPGG